MKRIIILIAVCFLFFGVTYSKPYRQDYPEYEFDHNRLRNFTQTEHYTQGEIETTSWLDALRLKERSTDPSDPAEGQSIIWQSDGTGAGDDGDIMMKITAGGATKTITIVDFSTY